MHYLHIVHNVYLVSPPCVSEYYEECFLTDHESGLVLIFLCCEFYNVVPGHCFSVERAACEGFSDPLSPLCSLSPLSVVPSAAIKRSGQIILQQNWFHIRSQSPIWDLTAS